MAKKVNVSPKDRWGGTPYDDAIRHGHKAVALLLKSQKVVEGAGQRDT